MKEPINSSNKFVIQPEADSHSDWRARSISKITRDKILLSIDNFNGCAIFIAIMKYRDVLPWHKFCQECSFYIFPSKLKITQFPLRCAAPHDASIASVRRLYAFDGRKTNCRKFYRVDLKCDEVRSHIKSRSAFVIIARQRDGQINQASGKTSEKTHKNSEHGASGSLCVRFDF